MFNFKKLFFKEKKRQEYLIETKTPDYLWLMDWNLRCKKFLSIRVNFRKLKFKNLKSDF